MKSHWQLRAEACRARMRLHALNFRFAICPRSKLTFNQRCEIGCAAIEAAIAERKTAEQMLQQDAAWQATRIISAKARSALRAEIASLEKLLAETPDDPWAKPMLREKLEELRAQILSGEANHV